MRNAAATAAVFAMLLVPSSRVAHAQAGPAWRSVEHGVEIVRVPAGWKATADDQSLRLTKTFERDGLRFEERISVQVSRDTYGSVEEAIRDLRREGYLLVDRARLAIDALGVPFWFLRRDAGDEESAWCALLLRAGRVYVIDLRSTPLDADALSDYALVVESFRLLPDSRAEGWRALGSGDGAAAERQFRALLSSGDNDINARYGLGLAYLAQGRWNDAVRELERVRPSLGLDEDVRRALGRAELARGRTSRGVTLLIEVLRDDPAWDDEVRPSILAAIRRTAARPPQMAGSPLSAIAIEFLSVLQQGDDLLLQSLRADFRREFDRALAACLSTTCDANRLAQLLAAVDLEQGMSLGMAARQGTDIDELAAAQAKLADGFRIEALLSRQM